MNTRQLNITESVKYVPAHFHNHLQPTCCVDSFLLKSFQRACCTDLRDSNHQRDKSNDANGKGVL